MAIGFCRFQRAAAIVVALVALAGCGSSSRLVNVWKDPTYERGGISNVLVMGLMVDPVRRRLWEDQIVAELRKRGTQATASYQIFPQSLPDTAQAIRTVRRRGFEGVLFASMLPTETSTRYEPGYVETVPITAYSWWANAYYTAFAEIYRPGYTDIETIARLRIDVWSTGSHGRMLWSATTETIDPNSAEDVRHEVTRLIVPELEKQGVVQVSSG